MVGRRALLGGAALSALAARDGAAQSAGEWREFLRRYMAQDGRVVDTGNGGVSHSEGQGYCMLLATYHDDRASFARLWGWTQATLAGRRDDALLAWRWRPERGVDDLNNATDGDLFVAAALMLAWEKWGDRQHLHAARRIARDVLRVLSVPWPEGRILLPGARGFVHGDLLMLNPSYHSPQLLPVLNRAFPDPAWAAVARAEKLLVDACCTGPLMLPPDWVRVGRAGGTPVPHPDKPPLFGYDAVRVPLMAAWAADRESRLALASCVRAWERFGGDAIPATVNVVNGQRSADNGSPGMAAIRSVAQAAARGWRPWLPAVQDSRDYYSAVLGLLARAAATDSGLL